MLLIICVERLLHIGSHFSLRKWWRWPHFPTKLAAVASFSYKIGGGGKDLATLLAAVLTWSGYWTGNRTFLVEMAPPGLGTWETCAKNYILATLNK